jgi:hypothetical protein
MTGSQTSYQHKGYQHKHYQIGHQAVSYQQATQAAAADVALLMVRYSFDLGGHSPERWIDQWLHQYPAAWMQGAVVEALYQGRYKAVSVWQILDLWQRRGKPLRHFSREFERMVAGRTLPLLFTSDPTRPVFEETGPEFQPEFQPDPICETSPLDASSEAAPLIMPPSLLGLQTQIPPYKPSQQFHLSLPEKIGLPQPMRAANQPPIQQFIPTPEASEFHGKLKSIAQALILANAQIISATLATRRIQPNEPEPVAELSTQELAPTATDAGPEQPERSLE